MDEIIADYTPWLWKLARGMTVNDPAKAEDLVQEGRIAIWRAYEAATAKGDCAKPGYLLTAARWRMTEISMEKRSLTGAARRKSVAQRDERRVNDWSGLEPSSVPGAFRDVVYRAHSAEIRRAINALPPGQRDNVYGRFWAGEAIVTPSRNGAWWYGRPNRDIGARARLREKLSHLEDTLAD